MRLSWASRVDARVLAHFERALSMESCFVALSKASGEGLSSRYSESGFKIERQRGAME